MEQKYVLGMVALAMVTVLGISIISAYGMGIWNSDLTEEEKAKIQEQREAIKTAIEFGDYETWEILMNEKVAQMQERINEDTFIQLQERHGNMAQIREAVQEAKETGDWSEVESLKEELGIQGKGHFGKKGFGRMGQAVRYLGE